jgi:membrane protease YdiL (CAAX protease family)
LYLDQHAPTVGPSTVSNITHLGDVSPAAILQAPAMTLETHPTTPERTRAHAALAWAAVVVLSVPVIVWREVTGEEPPWWFRVGTVCALALLWAVAHFQPAWHRMRPFLASMVGLGIGVEVVRAIFATSAWRDWQQDGPWPLVQVSECTIPLLMVVFLGVTLVGSGLRRQDLFLVRGDPDAPVGADPALPGFPPGMPWRTALFNWKGFLPTFLGAVVVISIVQIGSDLANIGLAVLWLPAIVLAAAVNALREEVVFRSVLLAHLERALGRTQAMWITAGAFGLGHFYGTPAGVPGVLLAGFLGLIFAKSILETRGLWLALSVHFLADAILYFFEAMTVT